MKDINLSPVESPSAAVLTGDLYSLDLRSHSYEDHLTVMPNLLDDLAGLGCWVLEQKTLSPTLAEVIFEVQLRTAFELYGVLLGAGLELTRDSHIRMSGLCTLRGHNPRHAKRRRVVTVRLELSFLEDSPSMAHGIVAGIA